jgi:hypothetical protein
MQADAKLGNGDAAGMGVWGVLIVGLSFISSTVYLLDVYYITTTVVCQVNFCF